MHKPTIFFLIPARSLTGAVVTSHILAQQLKDDAQIIAVVPQDHDLDAALLADFSGVMCIPMVQLSRRWRDLLSYVPALFAASLQLARQLRHYPGATLLLMDFYLMHGVVLRLAGHRGTVITQIQGHPRHLLGRLGPIFLRLNLWTSNHMVAVSHFIRAVLPPDAPVTVIHNALQTADRTREWHKGMQKRIVFIGNYIQGKGQDIALQAFALLAAQHGDAVLAFYGGDMGMQKNRDYKASLTQQAKALGISAQVEFHDFVNDTVAILADAYMAVNASRSESFSMTVLEACACAVPVVATRCGGPEEIIEDGVSGLLVPVDDSTALSSQMAQLLSDPARAEQIGRAAAQRAATHFSLERLRAQYRELFGLG